MNNKKPARVIPGRLYDNNDHIKLNGYETVMYSVPVI
jgi:hypothetical protein